MLTSHVLDYGHLMNGVISTVKPSSSHPLSLLKLTLFSLHIVTVSSLPLSLSLLPPSLPLSLSLSSLSLSLSLPPSLPPPLSLSLSSLYTLCVEIICP